MKLNGLFEKVSSRVSGLMGSKKPEILLASGIALVVTGTVTACGATLKVNEVLDEFEKTKADIDTALENCPDKYTEEDAKKDSTLNYVQTGVKFLKLYAIPTACLGLGITCLVASHGVMKNQLTAMSSAYTMLDESYKKYRQRVVENYGAQTDFDLYHGKPITEVKTEEDGKQRVVTKYEGSEVAIYDRLFDELNPAWSTHSKYDNELYLKNVENTLNSRLRTRGKNQPLFLNEALTLLNLPLCKAGQVMGWINDGNTVISLNYDAKKPDGTYVNELFMNGANVGVLLTFDVKNVIEAL